MTSDESSQIRGAIALHALMWAQAVDLQLKRVQAVDLMQSYPDTYLLVVAVRQVLLAAHAMNKAVLGTDGALYKAMTQFLSDQPSARDVRDVLVHFDEYSRGQGDLQVSGRLGQIQIQLERHGEGSHWIVLAEDLRVDLDAAARGAMALAHEVLSVPNRTDARQGPSNPTA